MFEIFKMQVSQMLGGKMKWLVVLCLSLPVILTLTARSAGGLGKIRSEISGEIDQDRFMNTGEVSKSANLEHIVWDGTDKTYGPFTVTEDGLLYDQLFWASDRMRKRMKNRNQVIPEPRPVLASQRGWIGKGRYVVRRGNQLWRDNNKPDQRRWSVHFGRARDLDDYEPSADLSLDAVAAIYHFLLYAQAISILLALFYGTSVLGHELDGKTLTYLFTRPLPRWKFIAGKYLGIVTTLVPATGISLVASWLIFGGDGGLPVITGLLLGATGAVLAYNALFILFGFLIPRRALIVALLYSIVFEFILSFVPALINQFTITYYLRSIVVRVMDIEIPQEATRIVGGASITLSLAFLFCLIAGSLSLAAWMAKHREYVIQDDA